MRFVIDMNLSPRLPGLLAESGDEAVHWATVGDPRAEDHEILAWARRYEHVLLTHDLDFGAILAATQADSPSVLQVRTQDVSPEHIVPLLVSAIRQYDEHLERGALITCEEWRTRARILPIQRIQ